MLQLPCEVQRIVKQVEDVYIAAHKRITGLFILLQVVELSMDNWSRLTFIDCVSWMCTALRDNKNS